MDDPELDTYTVEKVAVIVIEGVGRIEVVCVPFVLIEEGSGVPILLGLVDVSDATNDGTLLDDAMVNEAYVEVELSVVKL